MDWSDKDNMRLVNMILTLETADEAKRFLRDLLTENEIKEFAKRIKAAELLSKDATYLYIEEVTGLSSRTIARVSKWLKGNEKGYKTIFNKIHHRRQIQAGRGLS